MTTSLTDLTTAQLNRIIAIKERIEKLQGKIESIAANGGAIQFSASVEAPSPGKRKYHMTAAHKRKLIKALARARKIRWAKAKGKAMDKSIPAPKKDRRSSPAVRAKLAAAARARWAKVRAAGKTLWDSTIAVRIDEDLEMNPVGAGSRAFGENRLAESQSQLNL